MDSVVLKLTLLSQLFGVALAAVACGADNNHSDSDEQPPGSGGASSSFADSGGSRTYQTPGATTGGSLATGGTSSPPSGSLAGPDEGAGAEESPGRGAAGAAIGSSTGGSRATGGNTGDTMASGGSGAASSAAGGSSGTGGAALATGGSSGTSGAALATGGTTATTLWRPFSDDSPWNTPIGDDPELHPNSDELIADWASSSPSGVLGVNIPGYAIPLYWADADTPVRTVTCDIGGEGFEGDDGFEATVQMPIPDGAVPDPESDAHLLVVDRERALEWGLYGARQEESNWRCALGAMANLSGSGVRPLKQGNSTWYTSHGARACGFPLVAGLIRLEEIEAGRIEHALVVAYPHIRGGCYTSPASTAQVPMPDQGAQSDRGIPCGGRVQLDPSLDLDSMGLSRSGRIIARALQEYGAYVGDFSGGMSLYAEASPAAQDAWEGVLDPYELREVMPLDRFRVIAHTGPVYADDNADAGAVCE